MAGFGFTGGQEPKETWFNRRNDNGMSLADAMYAWGGMLKGDADPVGDMDARMQARRAQELEAEALRPILEMMQGQGQPQPQPQTPGQEMEGPGFTPPQQRAPDMATMLPSLAQAAGKGANINPWLALIQASQPKQPQYIEGPDGIYEVGQGAAPKRVQDYPAQPRSAPPGFQWVGDRLQVIPGYAEGVNQIGGARRDAVVSRPMPGAGRSSSAPKPPSGFILD